MIICADGSKDFSAQKHRFGDTERLLLFWLLTPEF
jgi:hypothetical protein